MYKYDGLLIYQSHDDEGFIEVVEQQGIRSLHFGTSPKQSSMCLAEPYKLELSYVRAMSSWQLFKPDLTEEALLIGLGGGSLTKHLLRHFPSCHIKVIECRQNVVKVARSHFHLPFDPRLKIIIGDGGAYIQQRMTTHAQRYALILIDAFDHENIASAVANEAFFTACQAVLTKDGILAINLWGDDDNPLYLKCATWLRTIFKQRLLLLPVPDRGNVIALAFNDAPPFTNLRHLRQRALTLEQHYQIEFPSFLKDLKKHNPRTFEQLFNK
jgi:spermidine synthase